MNDSLIEVETPKAGEPLTPLIDQRNQAALEAQVARRLELMRSKLTRKQLRGVKQRYDVLFRKLRRAKYNQLVTERAAIADELAMVLGAWKETRDQALKAKGLALAARGRAVQAKIAPLAPLAAEFEEISSRLNAHHRVLQLEREEAEDRKTFFKEAAIWENQIKAVFRQSPRLHHTIQTNRGKTITRIPRLSKAFIKTDKVYFTVQTMSQNPFQRWAQTWTSALPYGVDVADLVSDVTMQNLTAACGRMVKAERNQRSQNILYVIHRLDFADNLPLRILWEQVIDHYPQEDHLETPWAAGVGEDHKIVWQTFTDFPHVLIAGTNGGGKSNLINQMLATLITMNSPDELRLLLIDNKGGIELSHFDGVPHLLTPMVNRLDDVLPALEQLSSIMRQRFAMFLKAGARKLTEYNKRVSQPIPRIICVIDEMATLIGVEDTEGIQRELRAISSQGRAVGVHLVISTQHPSVDVIPGWIKTNLNLRVAAKMPHHSASQIIVDSISAAMLPDIPGRMVFRRGGFELTLQTPLIEDPAIARAVKQARKFPEPAWRLSGADLSQIESVPIEENDTRPVPAIPTPEVRLNAENVIRIALEKLDGRLSPSRLVAFFDDETEHEVRKIVAGIVTRIENSDGILDVGGLAYRLKKDRKTHYLKAIGDSIGEKSAQNPDTSQTPIAPISPIAPNTPIGVSA